MSSERKGSCLCGDVQFTVHGEPEGVAVCYCSHCSKNAGGPFQISARFDESNVKITQGEEKMRKYSLSETGSGKAKHKVFSTCCGCTLWTIPMFMGGDKWIVRTATLEGGLEDLKPVVEFYTKYRPAYLGPLEGTKQFMEYQ